MSSIINNKCVYVCKTCDKEFIGSRFRPLWQRCPKCGSNVIYYKEINEAFNKFRRQNMKELDINKSDTSGEYTLLYSDTAIPEQASTPADKITLVCNALEVFLLEKNKRYGNSALEPNQTFSKLLSGDQINVRMDDKLNRIKNSEEERMNDYVDLMGYLVLKCIVKGWTDFNELVD